MGGNEPQSAENANSAQPALRATRSRVSSRRIRLERYQPSQPRHRTSVQAAELKNNSALPVVVGRFLRERSKGPQWYNGGHERRKGSAAGGAQGVTRRSTVLPPRRTGLSTRRKVGGLVESEVQRCGLAAGDGDLPLADAEGGRPGGEGIMAGRQAAEGELAAGAGDGVEGI